MARAAANVPPPPAPKQAPELEDYPPFATGKLAITPGGTVWQYQPNVPFGLIEIQPVLPPPSNVIAPSLTYASGTGAVGSIIAMNSGSWVPTSPAPTYARRWFSDGVEIIGATGTSYTARVDDIDHMISGEVTATNASGSSQPRQTSNMLGPIRDIAEARAAPKPHHGKNHKKR